MNRILCVPNWSITLDQDQSAEAKSFLAPAEVHYVGSDADHGRTVTAFSASRQVVYQSLMRLASWLFPMIDLRYHVGAHPRVGALDVCPFIGPEGEDHVCDLVEQVAMHIAEKFAIPCYLYERCERGRHPSDLPSLRKGGFESLLGMSLSGAGRPPDFGPDTAHPQWGVSILGVRSPLLAVNVFLDEALPVAAKQIALRIRNLRRTGVPEFAGVRALGLALPSRGGSQVSMNFTLPDATSVDRVVEWIQHRSLELGFSVIDTELVGVIRPQDLKTSTCLQVTSAQVVDLSVPFQT